MRSTGISRFLSLSSVFSYLNVASHWICGTFSSVSRHIKIFTRSLTRGWAHIRQKFVVCLKQRTFLVSAIISCFALVFLVSALVSCILHLFLVFCTCFLDLHLFSDIDKIHKYLSNWAEKHVFREANFSVSMRVQNPTISAHFWVLGILRNFMKFQKILKLSSENFIFKGVYMVEYLSDLDEKWMVREVKFSSFVTHFSHVGTNSIPSYFSWAEKHVFRKGNFSVSMRIQNSTVSVHFWLLEFLRIFMKFQKILKFSLEKLYFQRLVYEWIFVGLRWKVEG